MWISWLFIVTHKNLFFFQILDFCSLVTGILTSFLSLSIFRIVPYFWLKKLVCLLSFSKIWLVGQFVPYRPSLIKQIVCRSISQIIFLTKFHFLQFQKWPKINFWTGKKFKTAKNAISRKKLIYLISRVFLPGLF